MVDLRVSLLIDEGSYFRMNTREVDGQGEVKRFAERRSVEGGMPPLVANVTSTG